MILKHNFWTVLNCFPQWLLGLIIIAVLGAEFEKWYKGRKVFCFEKGKKRRWKWLTWFHGRFSGTALYHTILPHDSGSKTIAHEWGHHVDGDKWGWLYLPVIGVASLCNNLESGKVGYNKAYYHKYPEWQADRNGGVRHVNCEGENCVREFP